MIEKMVAHLDGQGPLWRIIRDVVRKICSNDQEKFFKY